MFDTVDHDILLEVLHKKIGIDGNALNWYSNYLKPRRFKVNINKAFSTEKTMQFSISQGLDQGAFLFIAYTSTFPEVIEDLTLSSFADDCARAQSISQHVDAGQLNIPSNSDQSHKALQRPCSIKHQTS